MEIEKGRIRLHSLEKLLWKRLWTCRKTDCAMNGRYQSFPENPEKSEVFITVHPENESTMINTEVCRSVSCRYYITLFHTDSGSQLLSCFVNHLPM